MARFSVTVRPYKDHRRPNLKWVVNFRHPSKGRQRRFFTTREDADSEANARNIEIDNYGLQALELSAAQRIEALSAIELLTPFKVTLTEAVRDFVDRRKSSTLTFTDLVNLFMRDRERLKRSGRHLDDLWRVLGGFEEEHGESRASEITAEQIQDFIHEEGIAERTINHRRAMFHSVFEWAVRRRKLRENPVKQIEKQTVVENKVGILTPAQMGKLLAACADDADLLVTAALGGFAGIRPEEISRLTWDAIDLDNGQVDCAGEKTKTAKHRFVKIEPVLAAWLERVWPNHCGGGSIQSVNFKLRWNGARQKAGFAVRIRCDRPQIDLSKHVPWPHDGLRHSFASYHLAHFKNAAELALQMGHETTEMIYSNYRARVSDKHAAAWWALTPDTILSPTTGGLTPTERNIPCQIP